MLDDNVTRRGVLRTVAVGGAATVGMGTAAGDEGPQERIVGIDSPRAERAAERRADRVDNILDFGHVGKAVVGRFSDEAAENLRRRRDVRYVEENGEMHALQQTLPWGIDRVDADVLHDNGETGNGADVAVLDTGIDSDHYDLADNIQGGQCFTADCCGEAGGLFCSPNDNECHHEWDDDHDHGTHCAGIANAIDDTEGVVGVSTEANLWAGKVLDGCGSGSYDGIADGIRWAADQGHDVASMSLGGDDSSVVQDACQYAYDNGVLLVAAAGNDGPCTDCVGYPAAYDTVVAVSATSEDDSLADFSSTGPEVELAAPGENVLSTVPPESSSDGLDTFSGTSMACPHVSGAGGQLMANGYTNTEARQRLQDSAEDIGLSSNEQGHGLLDAEAAVLGDSGGGNSAPTVDSLSASEVETDDSDAEFDVDWAVSDADGNLDAVDLTLTDDTAGETEDTASIGVSGDTASGTTRLVAAGDDASGNDYTVELVVTDADGATGSDTTTVTETEETSGDSAPVIDSYTVTEAGSPNPHAEITADWTVSDDDADLDTVVVEVFDSGGNLVDSSTTNVSGSSASGTDEFKIKHADGETFDVTLTVTDAAGNSASETQSVTA